MQRAIGKKAGEPRSGKAVPSAAPGVLFAFAGMLAAVTCVAALEHFSSSQTEVPVSAPAARRLLRFNDMPDGGVAVTDAQTGQLVTKITGQAGFFRVILRGFAQRRQFESLPKEPPFSLTRWADGRLTLDDPLTRRHVELEAFGPTNEAVFATLLNLPEPRR